MNWQAFNYVLLSMGGWCAAIVGFVGAALFCSWLERRVGYLAALSFMLAFVSLAVAVVAGLLVHK